MRSPRWWQRRRFGMIVHANIASVPAWAPIGQYAEWYQAHQDGTVSDTLLHPSPLVETLAHHRDRWAHIERYDDFLPFLTFDAFDADSWAQLALDAGMGYTVMVAKHHDGLCWWDAPNTDRTVLHSGPARNVLGEYAAACERAGIVFGTYYSLLDWGDRRYPTCAYVDDVVHPHVLDLVDRYGSRMLWGDGHWGGGGGHWRSDELIAAARRLDPDLVVNDRWWSDGPGVQSFEYRLPPGIVHEPWEMRRGLGGSFAYNRAERGEHLLSPAEIVALLTEVVAKGGHLLLGVGPDATGRIPEIQAQRLRDAGTWVREHQDLVDRGEPWDTWGDDEARYLLLDGVLHAIDVRGHGRFAALSTDATRVSVIEALDGRQVGFDQSGHGVHIDRISRGLDPVATVYRVHVEAPPPAPIELFAPPAPSRIALVDAIAGAVAGDIVQLGEGTYLGPARIPDGVTVRGLGPDRTTIDGIESCAVALGAGARLEHCSVTGGGARIAWLLKPVAKLAGRGAALLGCRIDGHVEIRAADARVTSCSAIGVVATGAEHAIVARSTFHGMQWDCAIDVQGGAGHVIESCELGDVLVAIRLTGTVGAVVRGNRIRGRWWGVHLVDTEGTQVVGNDVRHTMRAVDVDGGTLAVVTGNAVRDGDSGCVLQQGASDCEIAGNHWERCRIGLLAWDAGAFRAHDNAAIDLLDPDATITIGP